MNIDKMEAGREMNVKIATDVMKWSYWDFKGDYEGKFPMFTYVGDSALAVYFDHGDQHIWFDPSRDIAAAWLVVEKIRERGLMLYLDCDRGRVRQIWRALFVHWEMTDFGLDAGWHDYGSSAPLAICRAALLATETK